MDAGKRIRREWNELSPSERQVSCSETSPSLIKLTHCSPTKLNRQPRSASISKNTGRSLVETRKQLSNKETAEHSSGMLTYALVL